ncbi:hypothetical protein ACJJTC_016615 [Scirpophaga incertulas]
MSGGRPALVASNSTAFRKWNTQNAARLSDLTSCLVNVKACLEPITSNRRHALTQMPRYRDGERPEATTLFLRDKANAAFITALHSEWRRLEISIGKIWKAVVSFPN